VSTTILEKSLRDRQERTTNLVDVVEYARR
jgi:hypothetical protein